METENRKPEEMEFVKNFDRESNFVRKKVCVTNIPFARTVSFRPLLPRATLLRRFALGYKYSAHTGLNTKVLMVSILFIYKPDHLYEDGK